VIVQIVWQGHAVAKLEDPEPETFMPGWGFKEEGDFVLIEGPLSVEFQQRLEAHETLSVTINGEAYSAYGRPGGRIRVSPTSFRRPFENSSS
jgi:hypothetical protein